MTLHIHMHLSPRAPTYGRRLLEYYTYTNKEVVTPAVAKALLPTLKASNTQWDLWERCSGSSRLSLYGEREFKLAVGFPIDLRYGWDIHYRPHQILLEQIRQATRPRVIFDSPDSRLWG